jgi:pyruvate,orthophosphate dikinase
MENMTATNIKPATKQFVFSFQQGDGHDKQLLGGKGANLCEMTQIGLNVPPGFVISTQACLSYLKTPQHTLPDGLIDQVQQQIRDLETNTGKGFGDPDNPLLLSVRSGSALSMPGMMDTILNLGLNSETLAGLIRQTANERFGYDAYRRFIQLFGKVALGIADEKFDEPFEAIKQREGVKADLGLSADHLREISEVFLDVVQQETGRPFPADVFEQLEIAVKAVFGSWMGKRAIDYRNEFKITSDMANGTAVNVMTMVFGNMGSDSATGVGFTRNPGTGENLMFGEYLVNAQGEDVVAGIRTPKPVHEMEQEMPEMYRQLLDLRNRLESHYHEIQDFEYTIENGTLYCLQTRNGKMNATARVRTSVEMANESLIDREQALLRVDPEELEQLLHPMLDPNHSVEPVAQGLPASPGGASGAVAFDADRAELLGRAGEKIILVREETKPEDIHGFFAAQGILTSRGGKTSHAAVVARGMGKPCVAGAEGIKVNIRNRQAQVGDKILHEGDIITIDGGTGNVYLGEIPTVEPEFSSELRTLLEWADAVSRLKVMANADTVDTARQARDYGAIGIGLCRTERMFRRNGRWRCSSCCPSSAVISRNCSRSWHPAPSPSACSTRRFMNSSPASDNWKMNWGTCSSCAVR